MRCDAPLMDSKVCINICTYIVYYPSVFLTFLCFLCTFFMLYFFYSLLSSADMCFWGYVWRISLYVEMESRAFRREGEKKRKEKGGQKKKKTAQCQQLFAASGYSLFLHAFFVIHVVPLYRSSILYVAVCI